MSGEAAIFSRENCLPFSTEIFPPRKSIAQLEKIYYIFAVDCLCPLEGLDDLNLMRSKDAL